MAGINLDGDTILLATQLVAFVAGFMKLERRLTKLETTQTLMINGLVSTGKVDRRNAVRELKENGET